MNRFARTTIALLSAVTAGVVSTTAWAIDIKAATTPGGLRYWLVEDHGVPIVSLNFSMPGGSARDPAGKEGATALMAGLLDQGAGTLDARAFKERQEDVAARMGFGASADRFTGSLRMLRDQRQGSVELLRLALTAPRFDAPAVDLARRQTVSSLRQREESPSAIAGRRLMAAMFGDHPYGRPGDGTAKSVAALAVEDLRAVAARQLTRQGLVLAVVGDTTAQEIGPLLDRAFGALPAGEGRLQLPLWQPAPERPGGRVIVVSREMPQSVVSIAAPGIRRDDPDWYAATVMNHVLGGGGFNSRLMTEVREKRGLSYGASSRLTYFTQAGLFSASAATVNDKVGQTIAIVREQFALMAKDGVTARELAEAKTYLAGSLALSLDSTGAVAGLLHSMQIESLPIDLLSRRKALYEAITAEDVKRVAGRLLRPDAMLVTVVGKPVGVTPTE